MQSNDSQKNEFDLGKKNVFKDARVRLILITNRRKTEREKKMKLA